MVDALRSLLMPKKYRTIVLFVIFSILLFVSDDSFSSLNAETMLLPVENSWIRIQNVGTDPAEIRIQFHEDDGDVIANDQCPESAKCAALQPGFGWSFFQQTLEDLTPGYQGSAFVTSDQPFVAMLARDSFLDNGRFQIGGDSLYLGNLGGNLYLPLIQNTTNFVSRIAVQNSSDLRSACVQLIFYEDGMLFPVAVEPLEPTSGCTLGGVRLEPRATMFVDEKTMPVRFGFDGSVVVKTYRTDEGIAAGSQTISAMVDSRSRNDAGLASYRGFGENEMSNTLVLPLVDRNATERYSQWSTRFRILSSIPNVPNEVTLLFDGKNEKGERIEIEHTVNVSASLTCDQRLTGEGACLPSDFDLPSTFLGTVRMDSTNPIAVVVQRISPNGAIADYRGFSAEEAARQVVLPVVNKNFGPWGDHVGWNSWFRVQTFDGSVAHVTIIYYSKEFPNGLFPTIGSIRIDGQKTFRQWEVSSLPDGWVGSAVIVADRPIVVLANLESDVFEGDPVMLYNAITLD